MICYVCLYIHTFTSSQRTYYSCVRVVQGEMTYDVCVYIYIYTTAPSLHKWTCCNLSYATCLKCSCLLELGFPDLLGRKSWFSGAE